MSTLNREKIAELLQIKSPDEIRAEQADRLDEAGLRFLAERERRPEMEDFLRECGQNTRELREKPPELRLPRDFDWEPEPGRPARWFFRPLPVPGLVMAAAIFLFGFLGFQLRKPIVLEKGFLNFQRIYGEPEAEALDGALLDALKQRGIFFFEKGEATGEVRYYKEAYNDLSQAWMMDDSDAEIERYLVRAHEIIQEDYEGRE